MDVIFLVQFIWLSFPPTEMQLQVFIEPFVIYT